MPQTVIALTCVLAIILFYDLEVRLRAIFARDTLPKRLAYISVNAPRLFFAVAKLFVGFRFDVRLRDCGPLPPRFLLIGNHQSLVDIPVVFRFFHDRAIRFVSKKELGRYIPLISQVLRRQGHCLIDRTAMGISTMRKMSAFASEAERRGWCPVLFPEGTRSRDGKVGAFHSAGVRRILEQAPVPVVAVAIDGGSRISHVEALSENVKGAVYRMRVVGIFPPPTGKADIESILTSARNKISDQIEDWKRAESLSEVTDRERTR